MRAAALVIVMLLVADAAARRIVIMDPPIVSACPGGKSWDVVKACLARQGKLTIERTLPAAKLVRLVQDNDGKPFDAGVYLYVQRADKTWNVGGMFAGTSYTIMDLKPLTIAGHRGYQLDIGQITRTHVSVDGATSVRAVLSTKRVLFCSGESYGCPDATTQCDVMIRGKTLWTFRGTIAFEPGRAVIHGDRSFGGQVCVPMRDVFLGWPTTP
ncbi:MAG: hypothetical protein JNL83_07205 [Myxococcales bacterium]|nr:hypothetical protein [Myxococcales bacterium]